jgi:hypothetical protein
MTRKSAGGASLTKIRLFRRFVPTQLSGAGSEMNQRERLPSSSPGSLAGSELAMSFVRGSLFSRAAKSSLPRRPPDEAASPKAEVRDELPPTAPTAPVARSCHVICIWHPGQMDVRASASLGSSTRGPCRMQSLRLGSVVAGIDDEKNCRGSRLRRKTRWPIPLHRPRYTATIKRRRRRLRIPTTIVSLISSFAWPARAVEMPLLAPGGGSPPIRTTALNVGSANETSVR